MVCDCKENFIEGLVRHVLKGISVDAEFDGFIGCKIGVATVDVETGNHYLQFLLKCKF